jgi:hypothetical protein
VKSRAVLRTEEVQRALELLALLEPPSDKPCEPLDLSRSDRRFLQQIIMRAADDALTPRRKPAKNADRNFWVAIDFHTRPKARNREKDVARAWNLGARQVATIASRNRRAVQNALAERPVEFWREALGWQLDRFVSNRD